MTKSKTVIENKWPHRIGCLLVCIVFPLIWVGNLVTTTDAGMAVPDWPNTYGYNLFLYPYREWFFGPWDLFVEHGHRLLASLAGLVSIVLFTVTIKTEERKWVRNLSLMILVMVIFQGVLGGIRVVMDERLVAKIHGCVGPLFFAMAVSFTVATGSWWQRVRSSAIPANTWLMQKCALIILATSFAQLALGAFIRHIDDLASPRQFTLLVALHITTAVLLVLGTLFQFYLTRRKDLNGVGVKASIGVLTVLIMVQFCLGLGTWVMKFGWPVWFENFLWAANFVVPEKSFLQINLVTAHAAVGSLILAFWTVHALRVQRVSHLGRGEMMTGLSDGLPSSSIA